MCSLRRLDRERVKFQRVSDKAARPSRCDGKALIAWPGKLAKGRSASCPKDESRVEKIKQMGPEKIAPLCGYLISDSAKDVTGQIWCAHERDFPLQPEQYDPLGTA